MIPVLRGSNSANTDVMLLHLLHFDIGILLDDDQVRDTDHVQVHQLQQGRHELILKLVVPELNRHKSMGSYVMRFLLCKLMEVGSDLMPMLARIDRKSDVRSHVLAPGRNANCKEQPGPGFPNAVFV